MPAMCCRIAAKRHQTQAPDLQKNPIDKAAIYILKRVALMHYDLCLRAGTPIAAGARGLVALTLACLLLCATGTTAAAQAVPYEPPIEVVPPPHSDAAPVPTDDTEPRITPSLEERLEPTWTRVELRMRWFGEMLPLFGLALAALVLFWVLGGLFSKWNLPFRLLSKNPLLQQVMRQVARTVFVLIGLLLALELLDATALLGAVLGAAGVLGLAFGFAVKDIVENYLASLLLSARSPFRVNDRVRIGEHEGKVVRMTTRETVLMTDDGNHLRLPNALVFKSVMLNFTLNPLRRFECAVGIGTAESIRNAQRVGIEALRATPGVCADPPPFAQVRALGDWTVDLRFFGWVDQRNADWLKVSSEGRRALKVALDAAGVSLPNPTYRVEMMPMARAEQETARVEQKLLAAGEQAAPVAEVAPDDHLDEQIAAEVVHSDEKNLLAS